DSNPLERERGITILAKNTAVRWQGVKINIVDTPGHADFGGEVERILRMVDGVLILVDAAEGPMPQTRFVTRKALALGLRPIVAINKIDRADAEPLRVHDEVLGLFIDLDATPEQLDAPFLYTSSRAGTATTELEHKGTDLQPLFRSILDYVPAPKGDPEGPFQMLVSTLEFSTFLGRIAIGRIERGRVRVGDEVALLPLGEPGLVADEPFERNRVTKLYTFDGLHRVEVDVAGAGDIVALSGFETIEIGRTFTAVDVPERMAGIAVEEPTISVDFIVNNSPFAGREGKYVTSRQLKDRLYRELERNKVTKLYTFDGLHRVEVDVAGAGDIVALAGFETIEIGKTFTAVDA
ncbi:MAG TPA: GTP-binding protein, partial [Acidimicrobiales bacterium]|nr:GTP-binding protein [Acidimicrobiales bacterium]